MYPAIALLWFYVWWRYRRPGKAFADEPKPKFAA
jgi:hypothetical protein